MTPTTQTSVAIAAKRAPLVSLTTPIHPPQEGQVLIRALWAASTPLDLHRADGGLLIPSYPHLSGSGGVAGVVAALGPGSDSRLSVGDEVITFAFHGGPEANHQEYLTVPDYLVGRVPPGTALPDAVTVPVNLVTVFHAATKDLGLELPWPRPARSEWRPAAADEPLLVWGAASSVGIYAVQVLRHWGYTNVLAVASARHHEYLSRLGATACFDYTKPGVEEAILHHVRSAGSSAGKPLIPRILDCVGSVEGTLRPLTRIAQRGTRVAAMLPIIIRDATKDHEPEYSMDPNEVKTLEWEDGVILLGVRTHHYLSDETYKEKMLPEIVPELIRTAVIEPNRYRVVEGATIRDRAQAALDILRNKGVSGERLVFRLSE